MVDSSNGDEMRRYVMSGTRSYEWIPPCVAGFHGRARQLTYRAATLLHDIDECQDDPHGDQSVADEALLPE